jgi:hypothetical protein
MRNDSGSTLPPFTSSYRASVSAVDFHWLHDLTTSSNRLHMLPNPAAEMAAAAV